MLSFSGVVFLRWRGVHLFFVPGCFLLVFFSWSGVHVHPVHRPRSPLHTHTHTHTCLSLIHCVRNDNSTVVPVQDSSAVKVVKSQGQSRRASCQRVGRSKLQLCDCFVDHRSNHKMDLVSSAYIASAYNLPRIAKGEINVPLALSAFRDTNYQEQVLGCKYLVCVLVTSRPNCRVSPCVITIRLDFNFILILIVIHPWMDMNRK